MLVILSMIDNPLLTTKIIYKESFDQIPYLKLMEPTKAIKIHWLDNPRGTSPCAEAARIGQILTELQPIHIQANMNKIITYLV